MFDVCGHGHVGHRSWRHANDRIWIADVLVMSRTSRFVHTATFDDERMQAVYDLGAVTGELRIAPSLRVELGRRANLDAQSRLGLPTFGRRRPGNLRPMPRSLVTG